MYVTQDCLAKSGTNNSILRMEAISPEKNLSEQETRELTIFSLIVEANGMSNPQASKQHAHQRTKSGGGRQPG